MSMSPSGDTVTTSANQPFERGPGLGARASSWFLRVVMVIAGLGLLIGFFMPWLMIGRVAELSGFSLLLTGGDVLDVLATSHRVMLVLVPLLGGSLVAGAISGHRFMYWLSVFAGASVLAFGLITLIMLFFRSTGVGLWIVVVSALLAFTVGLISVGASRKSAAPLR